MPTHGSDFLTPFIGDSQMAAFRVGWLDLENARIVHAAADGWPPLETRSQQGEPIHARVFQSHGNPQTNRGSNGSTLINAGSPLFYAQIIPDSCSRSEANGASREELTSCAC
jgi:hypothetical protein